jgi:tetratricopeptide (TPR) repeat protein
MPSPLTDQDKELAEFFTDVEHLRGAFKDAVAAPTLTKRLFVIHGVGGVGKSSLLRMFRLHCKSVNVPVALASGDETKSALDVIVRWADDLKADSVAFPVFGKTYEHYRALQAKVETEAGKIAGQAVKGVAKTTIETAASTIPGIGPLLGKLGGTSVEALADILMSHGFQKPDIDLLRDPTKELTDDFLDDIVQAAAKQRIVLMLDTFEQITALEDWTRDVAQRMPANVLLVVAGRALPNWSRAWDSWMATAQVEELKPMTEDVMRDLMSLYYKKIQGGEPNPKQVEAIIRFARGLPMVVTSAVQLWVKYGVEDFQSVKAEIIANLVDRLMEGVPSTLIPVLEAAAIVRWFDQPILRAVTGLADVRGEYNELRRFPFVRVRMEGLALHDAVREIIDENLRAQDSERHCGLHERAAAYFEERLKKATGEEAERLGLERLYHVIQSDETQGIGLFQTTAEELMQYRMANRLRELLNDVDTYPLRHKNSQLWIKYYHAGLALLEIRLKEARTIFEDVSDAEAAEPKLKAYSLCDFGESWARYELLAQPQVVERTVHALEKSLSLVGLDYHLSVALFMLARIARHQRQWDKQTQYLARAQKFFESQNNDFGVVRTCTEIKRGYGRQGIWKEFRVAHATGLNALSRISPVPLALKANLQGWWAWSWVQAGDYQQGVQLAKEALDIARGLEDHFSIQQFLCDLGWALGAQNRFADANQCYLESLMVIDKLPDKEIAKMERGSKLGFWGMVMVRGGEIEKGKEYLTESRSIKEKLNDALGIQEPLIWLGVTAEIQNNWTDATARYQSNTNWKWCGRHHFNCSALTGFTRVKHAQGDYADIPRLVAEAEQLAQQYEYNDHLASLRLTQGHIAWEGNALTWDNGFEAALHFYQRAVIYALRYNRFLLDEVLSGRPQGSPLQSIIPHCLGRGEEGRKMLLALLDWWQTGVNDIGTPRPDTISPIPEGIPLLEAERLAREREPGDGSPQKSVIEQIEAALSFPRASGGNPVALLA